MRQAITINDFEPAMLNFRAAEGLPLLLDLAVMKQDGGQFDLGFADPVMLDMIPRTTGRVKSYAATLDVAGLGIATFSIGGSDLKDRNGYLVRLLAQIEGITTLIATGQVTVRAGTGASDQAGGAPPTPALKGVLNLDLVRNDSYTWQFKLWADDAKTIPNDLRDAVVTAQIRSSVGGTILAAMGVEVKDAINGVVWLSLTSGQTGAMAKNAYWDMQIAYPDGDIKTPVGGRVSVTDDITRP